MRIMQGSSYLKDMHWLVAAQKNYPNDPRYYNKAIDDLGCDFNTDHICDMKIFLTKKQQAEMLWCNRDFRFFEKILFGHSSSSNDTINE